MPFNTLALRCQAIVPVLAIALQGSSVAFGDIVPISRNTTVGASWFANSPPFGSGDSASDGTMSLDFFSRSISSGAGSASQTSYLITSGAYASVSATGTDNGSVMQHAGASGTSAFNYVFQLTAPTTLFFNGTLSRNAPGFFTGYGIVRLYNDVTNALLFERSSSPSVFDLSYNFSDTCAVAGGRYRLAVTAANSGNGAAPGSYTSSVQVMMTTPTPGAASLLLVAMAAPARRRRS